MDRIGHSLYGWTNRIGLIGSDQPDRTNRIGPRLGGKRDRIIILPTHHERTHKSDDGLIT